MFYPDDGVNNLALPWFSYNEVISMHTLFEAS